MGRAGARHRFTIDEYHCMVPAGIFDEDSRVELIEGDIVEMSPIGGPHLWCVNRLTRLLVLLIGARAAVSIQNPIRLSQRSEPQPDVTVLRPRDPADTSTPTAADVLLLIEVADSSLLYDRRRKLPLYARYGIAEVWIVNLRDNHIEVHRQPNATGYQERAVYERGGTLSPLTFPDIAIPCDEILA
jgi:Uma2 family endonuclease